MLVFIRILQTSYLTLSEVRYPQSREILFDLMASLFLNDYLSRQKDTWHAGPKRTQELMLTNLHETIIELMQQEHAVSKE